MKRMEDSLLAAKLKSLLRDTLGLSDASVAQEELMLAREPAGLDSVAVLRLVVALEKEFAIIIGDADIRADNFRSLDALIAFVQRKLG